MRTNRLIVAVIVCVLSVTARAADSGTEKKQLDIRTMAQATLKAPYSVDPKAKLVV
jgi:hypothetical protein